jgi:hypothetical protein
MYGHRRHENGNRCFIISDGVGGQSRVVRHGTATDEDLYGFNLGYKITFREL